MHAVLAICLGACAGALLRWQLGLWLNHAGAWLPWGTLAA
ncbi:MAG TPA: fluoride ion transporter CrcB, partial [Ottowia sp.]|nr:fluoride ion transporter CrcB [Ottowia sp.]